MNKQVGETPLERINRFKELHPEYQGVKMTYAGRLDPMASGVLIVLAGDMVHRKDEFLKLPKTYECTAILGVETDTYDVLGLPSSYQEEGLGMEFEKVIAELGNFIGTFHQNYPPYSSKTINGKQMHTLAREGGFEDLEIPTQMVTVKNISHIRMASVALEDLVQDIIQNIQKVKGDFRQTETINTWERIGFENEGKRVSLVLFTIDVSGGAYIRGIVHELGQKLGNGACIISLKRTSVGEYGVLDK